ncbi:hypothetical protein KBD59_04540 [Candidatus Gracilibacteria bacterium]|nr:hypothetical protein [Candidatus Gracilibacteria bacterium]
MAESPNNKPGEKSPERNKRFRDLELDDGSPTPVAAASAGATRKRFAKLEGFNDTIYNPPLDIYKPGDQLVIPLRACFFVQNTTGKEIKRVITVPTSTETVPAKPEPSTVNRKQLELDFVPLLEGPTPLDSRVLQSVGEDITPTAEVFSEFLRNYASELWIRRRVINFPVDIGNKTTFIPYDHGNGYRGFTLKHESVPGSSMVIWWQVNYEKHEAQMSFSNISDDRGPSCGNDFAIGLSVDTRNGEIISIDINHPRLATWRSPISGKQLFTRNYDQLFLLCLGKLDPMEPKVELLPIEIASLWAHIWPAVESQFTTDMGTLRDDFTQHADSDLITAFPPPENDFHVRIKTPLVLPPAPPQPELEAELEPEVETPSMAVEDEPVTDEYAKAWELLEQRIPAAASTEKTRTSPAPSPSWLQKHFGKLFAATAATVGIGLAVAPAIKDHHSQEVTDGTREKVEELDNLVFNAIKKAAAELKAIAPEKLLADTKIRFNHRPSLTVRDAKADTDYAHSVDEFPWIERTAPGDIVIDERNEVELMSAEGGVLTVKDTSIQGIYHEKNKNTVVVKIALPEGDDVQLRQYQTSGYYKKLGGKRSAFIAFDVSTGKLMNTYVGYNNYDSQSNGEALNLNSSSTGVYSGAQEIFKALKPIIELGMTNPTEALKELTENGMPVETNAQGRLSGLNIMSQKKGNLVGYFIDFDIDISGKHIPQMFSDYVGQADFHYKGGREDIVPNKDAAEVGGKRATQKIFSDEFIYIGFEGQEPFAFYSIPKNGSIGAGLQHDLKLLAEGPNQLLHPYVVSQHDFDVFKRQRGTNQHGFWPVSSFLDQLH